MLAQYYMSLTKLLHFPCFQSVLFYVYPDHSACYHQYGIYPVCVLGMMNRLDLYKPIRYIKLDLMRVLFLFIELNLEARM